MSNGDLPIDPTMFSLFAADGADLPGFRDFVFPEPSSPIWTSDFGGNLVATTLRPSDFSLFGEGGPQPTTLGGDFQTTIQASEQISPGSSTPLRAAEQAFQQFLASPEGGAVNVEIQTAADGSRTISFVNADGSPANPGIMAKIGELLKPFNDFAGTTIGKVLLAGGIGALTLAIARGATGGQAKIPLPQPTPQNPIFQAGQGALLNALRGPGGAFSTTGEQDLMSALRSGLSGQQSAADILAGILGRENLSFAEESPAQRAIRLRALGNIPELMGPPAGLAKSISLNDLIAGRAESLLNTQPTPLADTIQGGLASQVQNVLAGNYSNPQLERQIKQERDNLVAALNLRFPGSFITDAQGNVVGSAATPASQALADFDQRATELRETDKRNIIAAYTPLQQNLRAFNINNPQEQQRAFLNLFVPQQRAGTQLVQSAQTQGLQNQTGLAQFGHLPLPQLQTGLSQIAPITPLLGLEGAEAATARQNTQNFSQLLAQFQADQAQRAGLAQGIGQIGGIIAGGVFGNPFGQRQPQPVG